MIISYIIIALCSLSLLAVFVCRDLVKKIFGLVAVLIFLAAEIILIGRFNLWIA